MLGIIGSRNGRLVALRFMKEPGAETKLECRCICGAIHVIIPGNWVRTKSCGCHRRDRMRRISETINKTHGLSGSPEYLAWRGMLNRCYRKKDKRYAHYGGRGIEVCDRWRGSFETFYADLGPRPGPEYSLGRVQNDEHYTPMNVEWQTPSDQANNTSRTIRISFDGEILSLANWARKIGVNYGTLKSRLLNGWSVERALLRKTS